MTAPPSTATRPTSDRVREATFNALHSLDAVEGAVALDLFAGSGALGIEALSRGAARVTFVERDRGALAALRANLSVTALGARAEVVPGDVLAYCARATAAGARFDLAFLDPPYASSAAEWDDLLALVPAAVVVIESDREVEPGPDWEVARRRRYGSTVVAIGRRSPATPSSRRPGRVEPPP